MCVLHRLHIVDSAATGTFSSVPQSKQWIVRSSGSFATFCGFGFSASCTWKCWPQLLQTVEMAEGGTNCECPQCGQGTGTFSCLLGGILRKPVFLPKTVPA